MPAGLPLRKGPHALRIPARRACYAVGVNLRPISPAFALLFLLSGCHRPQLPTPAREEAKAEQHAEVETQREQIAMIPQPSKSRFETIRSVDSWENPYIIVQESLLELHVLMPDSNPSGYGAGGMFRPAGARRQVLTISPEKLGEAVSSIPAGAWPYGRVIAVQEPRKVPRSAEPAIRRAMEGAVGKLNDLGLVVYDPTDGSVR